MKHRILLSMLAAGLALSLSACSFGDFMSYLYGSETAKQEETAYQQYDGSNGVSVIYDTSVWEEPTEPQEDTVSLMCGTSFNYTAVLLQVTDSYTDFLAQSGEELTAETTALEYEMEFTVPDAQTKAVRYDCGSYQAVFAEVTYDNGLTVYVSSMTHSADTDHIVALLRGVFPTGQTPESAAALLTEDSAA